MTLSAREIAEVVVEIDEALAGGRVRNVHAHRERALVLTVRAEGENRCLLLSAEPSLARLHLVARRPPALPEPPELCRTLRRELRGARIVTIRQLAGDRIVELEVRRPGPAAAGDPPGDDTSAENVPRRREEETVILVHEVFDRRPNLLLVDRRRRILAETGAPLRGGKRLVVGETYVPPPPPPPPGREGSSRREGGASRRPEPARREGRFGLSLALEEAYSRETERQELEGRRRELLRGIREERRRRGKAGEQVARDLDRASSRERDRRLGELLKGAYGSLRRGLEEIEVVDYFSPGMERVRVELDPKLTPQENIERYFKRYRKAERAVAFLTRRLELLREEERRLEELEKLTEGAEDLSSIEKAEERARPFLRRSRGAGSRKGGGREEGRATGPRRFVSADGCEILVGRSARENDRLTFRLARGNDVFLHVAGRPGSHVVLRPPPGKDPPLESLLDAAQLALYFSLPQRSSAALIEGARADVDYTPVKHVRKPKGAAPGLVLLATHKTLRVEIERRRLERLLGRLVFEG